MTATAPDRPAPRPPTKPDADMCCNRGCCPCIFDYYWDALDRWKGIVERLGHDPEALLAARGDS